jgi:hypothetical protein
MLARAIKEYISLSNSEKEEITIEARKTIESQHLKEKMVVDMTLLYQDITTD